MTFDSPGRPLLIDHVAAAPLDDGELRAWASQQRVFVSSVIGGMTEERAAAVRGVGAVGAIPVVFEEFGGRDDDPEAAYVSEVASSDIYLGILGERYGVPAPSGYGATHAEYNEAQQRGLRVSVWTTTADMDGRQQDFRDEVRVFHTTGSYEGPNELERKIEARLREIAAAALTPWVKVGDSIVRASSLKDDGSALTLTAGVRDPSIVARLEGLRPGMGPTSDQQVTWRGRSASIRVASVTTEGALSSRLRQITIAGQRQEIRHRSMTGVSTEGFSAKELIDLRMRTGLFGEHNPLDGLSFMGQGINPLVQLEGITIGEDAYAEIAQLLITEGLAQEPGVDHLTNFQLGPQLSDGRRRLRLSWMPTKQYTNVEPEPRSIEGLVQLG